MRWFQKTETEFSDALPSRLPSGLFLKKQVLFHTSFLFLYRNTAASPAGNLIYGLPAGLVLFSLIVADSVSPDFTVYVHQDRADLDDLDDRDGWYPRGA